MYKKLHRNLTFIFSVTTGSILIIMSLFYLYLYQKDLTENSFLSFSQESSSIISNLAEQEDFSSLWMANVSAGTGFLMAFYDKGMLLPSCRLVLNGDETLLAQEVYDYGFSNYPVLENPSGYTALHEEFQYKVTGHPAYYASVATLPKHSGRVTGVILYDTVSLQKQIARQRMRFAVLNGIGVLCLSLFSRFYTGRLLAPIRASHERQNAFIAAASHELRTPLAVILSAVSASGKGTPEEKEAFLRTIETESGRMSLLVDDMLTLSRADNRNFIMHLNRTELDTLLLETSEAFEPLAGERQVRLTVKLPDKKVSKCRCDGDRIRQVLEILLSNALCYGKDGGIVTLELKEKSSRFLLTVADRGPGIPDADKPYIFDRFYRGDASRSTKDHFGLGLCIAREIMDAHRGSISVTDTPGGGATFCLELKKQQNF